LIKSVVPKRAVNSEPINQGSYSLRTDAVVRFAPFAAVAHETHAAVAASAALPSTNASLSDASNAPDLVMFREFATTL
jgi:hypothetical protein